MQVLFLRFISSSGVYPISPANVADIFNVNIPFKGKYKVSINDNSFKYICVVCYLKLGFYSLTYSAMSNLNSVLISQQRTGRDFIFLK